ncbi:DNA cytosine methyltransferase [Aurantimonas sp. Leaf443]|uniref:DNA cytosine methyltransferase n=1 Tax=Aurantimonas sp. Leaf443 TaxID=1736378 RepID=UPI0006FF0787|nr:DNA cytosine methyltransferase [Aurantimonas sp. Leaf443]KQT83116.1 modification methylase [Aurantimonas sp. Leaf443]
MTNASTISAVDLFCGVGGLTFGLEEAGIDVRLGVDIDSDCKHPITRNTRASFLAKDVSALDASTITDALSGSDVTLLAGCAPCQPFSTYSRGAKRDGGPRRGRGGAEDWRLVEKFADLVEAVEPDLVTMENVPPLARQAVFETLVRKLDGYFLDYQIVECSSVGLPQKRKRLVLLASKLGPISVPQFGRARATVRSTIGALPPLAAGEVDSEDRLHCASRLSEVNLSRIKASVPGGTWRDWPAGLRAACHVRDTGATFPSVYGRMEWDAPAPTITTQCFGYGNGRFGHPTQDRAISLREAAMLQGFPRHYSFIPETEPTSFARLGRLIGNAVPVTLSRAIGDILVDHVRMYR